MTAVAYILAGGRSRRFGADKATFLLADGSTLLTRTLAALRPHVDDVVLALRPDQEPQFRSQLPSLRSVVDPGASRGPMSGLAAALEDAADRGVDPVAVVACDMPWLDGALVAQQLTWHRSTAATACVPRVDGFWQPMHGSYRVSLLPALWIRLENDQLRLQALLDDAAVHDACDALGHVGQAEWRRSSRSANTPDALDDLPLIP